MSRILTTILTVLTAWQIRSAEPATAAPLTPDCRYLFIIDTSLSMTRLQESIASSVSRIIATGLDGQMAPGEVFTIWTFNEDVQQHEFPLTSWSPERGQVMGERVGEFLRSRRYRRVADMRALINGIYQAKRFCPRLAVFLVTNGEQVLVGTPFDRNINVIYGRRFEEMRAARVPFLTTLLCKNGEFVGWNNIAANEPLDLPLGSDGTPVVGHRRQPLSTNPAPVPPDPRTPALGPVTNQLAMMVPDSAPQPVAAAELATPDPAPAVPATERKVVELNPAVDSDAPKIVKPTEIAPEPKVELPKLPFTKPTPGPVEKPPAPAPKPVPQSAPSTNAPSTNAPAIPVPSPAKPSPPKSAEPAPDPPVEIDDEPPPVKPTKPAVPVALAPATNPPPRKAETLTTNRAPDVVLAVSPPSGKDSPTGPGKPLTIVTQVVNVAFPKKPEPKPTPKPEPPPPPKPVVTQINATESATNAAAKIPSPSSTPAATNRVAVTNDAPPAATNVPPKEVAVTDTAPPEKPTAPETNTFTAAPRRATTNFAGAPVPSAPRPPAPGDGTVASNRVPTRDMIQWIYLGAAILLLIFAGFTGWKLMTPPIDASLISQSMEDRDNG